MSNLHILTADDKQAFDYPPPLSVETRALCFAIDPVLEKELSKLGGSAHPRSDAQRKTNFYTFRDVAVLFYGRVRVTNSSLKCFHHFIQALIKYQAQITDHFLCKNNGGFVGGFNHKVEVLKRRRYGLGSSKRSY